MTIEQLNVKQLIGALSYYNCNVDTSSVSFEKFLSDCEIEKPSHENSFIVYSHDFDGLKHFTRIPHGFYNLYSSEERRIAKILRSCELPSGSD